MHSTKDYHKTASNQSKDPALRVMRETISFFKANKDILKLQLGFDEVYMIKQRELNLEEQSVLEDLKRYHLTENMLLTRKSNGYRFSFLHGDALRHLLIRKGLNLTEALKRIEGASAFQASKLTQA
jgi:hypothetical protein